jgi:hypothetical protein
MGTLTLLTVDEYWRLPPLEDDLPDESINGQVFLPPIRTPSRAQVSMRVWKLIQRQSEARLGETVSFHDLTIEVASIFQDI